MKFVAAFLPTILILGLLIYLSVQNLRLNSRNKSLSTLLKGLDEPALLLPEKERQDWARRRLQREEDDYLHQKNERLSESIRNFTTPPLPREGNQ